MLVITNTQAFDKLSEAQEWIYNRSHLANTSDGQILTYKYSGANNNQPIDDDQTTLSVVASHDDDRRDVEVEFLSGEQKLPLPPFSKFRGNPVIIAMLEHVAQSMSAQTGGGALYFRNRIRDSLAGTDVTLSQGKTNYANAEKSTTTLTFYPFKADEYLATYPVFKESRFTIELGDDIPGGVVSIQVSAQSGQELFERKLSLQ